MKKILQLIISLVVIALVGYTIYFLISSNNQYFEVKPNDESGNIAENNQNDEDKAVTPEILSSGNEIETDDDDKTDDNTGVNNEENAEIVSGDTLESKIASINMIETKNRLANLTKSLEDDIGLEIIGLKNKEYMESFETDEMHVTVQVAGSMVYIIPFPDFVDNAQYHYDENGNLALYICEFIGVGGEVRYYFENGVLLTTQENVEEDIEITYESSEEIIDRAALIYERYMK